MRYQKLLTIVTMLFATAVCSLLGALADRFLAFQSEVTSETRARIGQVEMYRRYSSDAPLRATALSEGYQPLFFPNLLKTDQEFLSLAKRLDVAPLAPQPRSRLYHCNEGYGLVTYISDRYGFRNDDLGWDQSIDGFLIGDSFVHGACLVDQEKTLANLISPDLNVLSLGTQSNSPIHYAALLKTFVPKFRPRYVFLFFYPNDFEIMGADNQNSYYYEYYWRRRSVDYFQGETDIELSSALQLFYEEASTLMHRRVLESSMVKARPRPSFYGLNSNEIRRQVWHDLVFFGGISKENFALKNIRASFSYRKSLPSLNFSTELAVDELHAQCEEFGCSPIVVFLPDSKIWRPDSRSSYYKDELRRYVSEYNIPFIDADKAISGMLDSDAYAPLGPHFSEMGYSSVARLINEQHGQLPQNLAD